MGPTPFILIATAQPRNGELLRESLTQAGYTVVVVDTPDAVLQAIKTQPAIRLALVDIAGWSVSNCAHACAHLRENGIPFILVGSRNESSLTGLALQFGASGVLVKPLTTAKLVQIVRGSLVAQGHSMDKEGHTYEPQSGMALVQGGMQMERVALLLESSENARLLQSWLASRYQVVAGPVGELLQAAEFDLGILDAVTLTRWAGTIQDLRHNETPVWLPFLLLTPRQELRIAEHHLWQTVDELILLPIEKLELQSRVEILLRARRLSLELYTRYQRLFEHVPIGLYHATPEERLLAANPTFLDMLRAPHLEAIPPAGWYADLKERDRLLQQLEERPRVQGVEVRLRTLTGEEFWGRLSLQAIRNNVGHLVALEGAIENVDEVIRARQERERWLQDMVNETQRIQQILATVPESVLLFDAEGKILLANAMARTILPALAGIQGAVGDRLTHLGTYSLEEVLTSPPVRGLWHEITCDNRTYEMLARPVEGLSKTLAQWVLVIKDVTKEKEIRMRLQQQERLASVGQLAAGIAHDFNNIMAVITLYAQLLERAPNLSGQQRDQVLTIGQQAAHATRLIQQILDFSRRSILERRPLDLLPFIKEQTKLLAHTLPENVRIRLDYRNGEYRVLADPTSIQQVLMNLAINARDAMPEGGTLKFKLERIVIKAGESPVLPDLPELPLGEWVRLSVEDTGTGIPNEVLPHIFEPFFTTKGPGKGSGLGLAQVHGIVAQHDGYITVETLVGAGTSFHIYLPALETHPLVEAEKFADLPMGHGQTILVVEDNESVRKALTFSLEQLAYRVVTATDGKEALLWLETSGQNPDALISDVVMPGMGGVALVRQLRQSGWLKPIIMLTGHALEESLNALRDEKLIDGCLTKPVMLEALAQLLHQLLSQSSAKE